MDIINANKPTANLKYIICLTVILISWSDGHVITMNCEDNINSSPFTNGV